MIKILIAVGWIFNKYKLFWRIVYKFIFKFIKYLILFINGRNIEEILKSDDWLTTRSVLFFFTNIIVQEKPEKDFPVKRFKIKWYIWVIHYIWAAWVILKLLMYLFVLHLYNYLKKGIWIDLWLMLLEYWRWRLAIFNWTLHIAWIIYFVWHHVTHFILTIHQRRTRLDYLIKKKFGLVKIIMAISVATAKLTIKAKLWSLLIY